MSRGLRPRYYRTSATQSVGSYLMCVQQKTLNRASLLGFLKKLEGGRDYITVYLKPSSFPHSPIDILTDLDNLREQLREATNTDPVLREAERYGTGAVIIWSQNAKKLIIIPPFPVTGDKVFYGKPEVVPVRQLLDQEHTIGLVLLNWGSYALAIIRNDKVLEYKVGTGYIHKKHRKGGRSEKRFARRTEEQKKDFLRRVANRIDERFRTYEMEQIFVGGNRLITKPIVEECPYLASRKSQISGRLFSFRSADRETLHQGVELISSSTVFDF